MITNMSVVSLVDAAATPVTHNFTPASRVAENTARWVDREHNNGVAIGYRTLTYSVKEPASADGVTRQKLSLALPLVDFSVANAPKLLGVNRCNIEFITTAISSDQDVKDLVQMVRDALIQGATSRLGDNLVIRSLPY